MVNPSGGEHVDGGGHNALLIERAIRIGFNWQVFHCIIFSAVAVHEVASIQWDLFGKCAKLAPVNLWHRMLMQRFHTTLHMTKCPTICLCTSCKHPEKHLIKDS